MWDLLINSALWSLSRLDLARIHAVGATIGEALYRFPNGLRRVAEANLHLCFPDLAAAQRDVLLRHTLIEGGKTAAELAGLWRWEPSRILDLVRHVSGEQALRSALAKGRGAVLAGPHLGAWELVGLYCASRYSLTSLYRPPRIPKLEEPVRRARERTGATLVPTTARGVRALFHA
jgi:KDO2-lipid IV(A) lauroyltransferase